ncbi:hypothetical protein CONLIGDRAFT_657744 [Coniochaeta ligniaria NRRL 30616]|uniref:Zn(2)-C6 fungal-type domain-containing protein n=1 Tax=Coniochaeta ligniaria NRRL 30616 TaxID=1408157 RepID=A0A1J7J309_9PEZI|nr:hypothetical protein CONLIGDRAFT_657744 [Coniochaeta ligniaria NRRL 30616]
MAPGTPSRVRIKRVRTGCWTCRRRGYRCDEAKPSCQSCTRLGLDCEGYGVRLRWVANQSPGPTQLPAVERDNGVNRGKTPVPSSHFAHLPQKPPGPSNLPMLPPGLSGNDVFLVQHFFYTISGLLASTSDRSINVYCHLMLPMALSSPLVLDAVLLLSATHLSSRYPSFQPSDSRYYRARVLSGLIDRIDTYRSGAFELTTLATIILLSIAEVFEARSPEDWIRHLGAAGRIIAAHLVHHRKHPLDKSTRMVLDIFAYHNVLAMVATGGGQPSLYVEEFYAENKWASLSGKRTAFLASVDTLLSIAARLSSLAGRCLPSSSQQPMGEADAALVDRLGAQLRCWSPPEGIEPDTRGTAEAMRQATLIVYYKLVRGTGEDASEMIVACLRDIPVRSSTVASHVWPLYMAGSVLTGATTRGGEEGREFIRDRLVAMRSERGIRSLDASHREGVVSIDMDSTIVAAIYHIIL